MDSPARTERTASPAPPDPSARRVKTGKTVCLEARGPPDPKARPAPLVPEDGLARRDLQDPPVPQDRRDPRARMAGMDRPDHRDPLGWMEHRVRWVKWDVVDHLVFRDENQSVKWSFCRNLKVQNIKS